MHSEHWMKTRINWLVKEGTVLYSIQFFCSRYESMSLVHRSNNGTSHLSPKRLMAHVPRVTYTHPFKAIKLREVFLPVKLSPFSIAFGSNSIYFIVSSFHVPLNYTCLSCPQLNLLMISKYFKNWKKNLSKS